MNKSYSHLHEGSGVKFESTVTYLYRTYRYQRERAKGRNPEKNTK